MSCMKGLGVHRDIASNKGISELGLGWYYNWEYVRSPQLDQDFDYIPMIWGENGARDLSRCKIEHPVDCLLGFNEPDNLGQANMSVDLVIDYWPILEGASRRLGSPGAVHADREWMLDFMKKAGDKDLRVDFICAHWYDLPDPSILLNRLQSIYELYGMPIWLTEFACVDWDAGLGNPCFTQKDVVHFIETVLPEFEKMPFVERYAWFSGGAEYATSHLFTDDGSLSIVGEAYSNSE